jgi:hypothetical protein
MDARAAIQRWVVWLETMRAPEGYGGPVAHWWQNCLSFTGAGLDWRYEGIIHGCLNMHRHTDDPSWLATARRAGDDLLRGQLPDGRYRHSSFELNPYPAGTPHEAACDLALLRLAWAIRQHDDPAWRAYLDAARRNIMYVQMATLWDEQAQSFRDHPHIPSFVPNKAATLAEALCALAELSREELLIDRYALPTLEAVLAHQVRGGALDGAIHQYSQQGRKVAAFFPFYTARCVPGLLEGYAHTQDERWVDAALRAMRFVLRWQYDDGSFPQVVYMGGRVNRYPQWVAGTGDILRAMLLLQPYGLAADRKRSEAWLLSGWEPHGAVRTAHGFAAQASQRDPGALPEFRDLLPVVGWADKAFRYLSEVGIDGEHAGLTTPDAEAPTAWEAPCQFRGVECRYHEDSSAIELWHGTELWYRWRKGARWAEACAPHLFWK